MLCWKTFVSVQGVSQKSTCHILVWAERRNHIRPVIIVGIKIKKKIKKKLMLKSPTNIMTKLIKSYGYNTKINLIKKKLMMKSPTNIMTKLIKSYGYNTKNNLIKTHGIHRINSFQQKSKYKDMQVCCCFGIRTDHVIMILSMQ